MTDLLRQIVDLLKASLSVRGVVSVLILLGAVWIVAGLRLRGRMLKGWLLVPILVAIACFCVAGQEHLFPDQSFEGPHLIRLGSADAITLADLIGVAVGGIAVLLVVALILRRIHSTVRRLADSGS
jgi:hypothetical protein